MPATRNDSSLHQQAVAAPASAGARSGSELSTEALTRAAAPLAARGGRASQRERILSWARRGHVIHADDWWPGPGPDGGPGVRAVRSRIPELEALGYGFDHTARPDHTIEYHLAYVPEHPAPRAAAAPESADVAAVDDIEQLALEFGPSAPSTRAAA